MGLLGERSAYQRSRIAVYAAMFLIRLAFGISLVTFSRYLHSDDFVYALVVTASPLLELITVVFAGVFTDRYGKKGVLLTGLGLGAVSLYGLALTRDPLILAAVHALHGIAAALILVTTLAVIATFAPPEHRGREMGYFNLANIFGWIVGFAAGGVFLDVFAGRLEYTFILSGAFATVGLLYANRTVHLPNDKPAERFHSPPSLGELYTSLFNRRVILLTIPWLIVFMLVAPFLTFFARITGVIDVSGARTALGVLFVGGLFVLSQVVWGRLSDRYGREGVMLVGAVGFALFMGLIVYAFFETDSADPQVLFADIMSHWFLLTVFLFTALAFAPAGLAAMADEAKEGAQGTTMSAYSLSLSLGFIVGPPLVGLISERWGGRGMVVYFALLAVGLLAVVLTRFIQVRLGAAGENAPMHDGRA